MTKSGRMSGRTYKSSYHRLVIRQIYVFRSHWIKICGSCGTREVRNGPQSPSRYFGVLLGLLVALDLLQPVMVPVSKLLSASSIRLGEPVDQEGIHLDFLECTISVAHQERFDVPYVYICKALYQVDTSVIVDLLISISL